MYLEVIQNETVVSDTTNQEYVRTKFMQVDETKSGKLVGMADKTAFRVYNPGKEFPVGTLFMGKIMKFDTTDYTLRNSDKVVNKITFAVIGEENPIEIGNALLHRTDEDAWLIVNGKSTKPEAVKPPKAEKPPKAATVK